MKNIRLCFTITFTVMFIGQPLFGAEPVKLPPKVSAVESSKSVGRYQLFFGPNVRADIFLVDTVTGRIWQRVASGNETGDGFEEQWVAKKDNLAYAKYFAHLMIKEYTTEIESLTAAISDNPIQQAYKLRVQEIGSKLGYDVAFGEGMDFVNPKLVGQQIPSTTQTTFNSELKKIINDFRSNTGDELDSWIIQLARIQANRDMITNHTKTLAKEE